jgi:chemotaxis protein CheX
LGRVLNPTLSNAEQGKALLQLAPVLGLKDAAPLQAALVGLRGQGVMLDASQVSRLGGQCLQVLLSARAAWDQDGLAFCVSDPSPDFTDGLALLGAAGLLEQPSAQG